MEIIMRKFLSNSVIATLMTILSTGLSSEGNAMGSKPETKTILVSCIINGDISEIEGFAQSICPTFTNQLKAKWPEKIYEPLHADASNNDLVLEINVQVHSAYHADVQFRWAQFVEWRKQNINSTEVATVSIMDSPLNATIAEQLIRSHVNSLDIF